MNAASVSLQIQSDRANTHRLITTAMSPSAVAAGYHDTVLCLPGPSASEDQQWYTVFTHRPGTESNRSFILNKTGNHCYVEQRQSDRYFTSSPLLPKKSISSLYIYYHTEFQVKASRKGIIVEGTDGVISDILVDGRSLWLQSVCS